MNCFATSYHLYFLVWTTSILEVGLFLISTKNLESFVTASCTVVTLAHWWNLSTDGYISTPQSSQNHVCGCCGHETYIRHVVWAGIRWRFLDCFKKCMIGQLLSCIVKSTDCKRGQSHWVPGEFWKLLAANRWLGQGSSKVRLCCA